MRHLYRLAGGLLALGFVLYPVHALTSASGAPAGFNGSPPNNITCVICHGSFPLNSGTGSITLEAPATFVPGDSVTLTVALDNTTEPSSGGVRQGFELSVHAPDGALVGELVITDPLHTQHTSGDNGEGYVTHTPVGTTVAEWTMRWVAPEEAPDSVTVYIAANAANGNGSPTGDYIYTHTATLQRGGTASEPAAPLAARVAAVFPNPVRSEATVEYALEQAGPVTLTLYDGRGRAVRTSALGARSAGAHAAVVPADGLASGVYFLEVATPAGTDVRPVTVVR